MSGIRSFYLQPPSFIVMSTKEQEFQETARADCEIRSREPNSLADYLIVGIVRPIGVSESDFTQGLKELQDDFPVERTRQLSERRIDLLVPSNTYDEIVETVEVYSYLQNTCTD